MPIYIDRRLNPRDKSLGNRQRFLKRARDELKRSIREQIRGDRIEDVDDAHTVSMPVKDTSEPRFEEDLQSGDRTHILPGNKTYVPGDRIDKSGRGNGMGHGPSMQTGEDDFRFVLSREEVLEFFFEDLELPYLVKQSLKEILTHKPRRAGFAVTGAPTNINVGRTMRNSHARRIALKRPRQAEIEEIEKQLASLSEDASSKARHTVRALMEKLEDLQRRRKLIAYIDPIDIRFNRFEAQPIPNANAVMFCLMDVSGSMGEREKDLAKRFFVLLHLFLKRRYARTDLVFIRHTHEAEEVDQETFFTSTQSGGTIVSTALKKMINIIEDRYAANEWNIYAAQASDGDNFVNDSEQCIFLLNNTVMPLCQYFAYVEIIDERERHLFGSSETGTSLWKAYRDIEAKWENFQMTRIAHAKDIYPVFRQLFTKQPSRP